MNLLEKGLPDSLDSERFVLGSILLDDAIWPDAAGALKVEDFSLETHRRLFGRMAELQERGEKIDRVTLYNELCRHNEGEACGGLTYLVSLDNGLPHLPNVDSYIRIVKEKSLLRQIIIASQATMNRALLAESEPEEILTGAQDSLVKLTTEAIRGEGPISMAALIEKQGVAALLAPRRHGTITLPFERLDGLLCGIWGGQIIVVMADTSRGKSTFAYQCLGAAARQGFASSIWSLEVGRQDVFQILTQQACGIWPQSQNLTGADRHVMYQAGAQLHESGIHVDTDSRNVASFVAGLRRIKSKSRLGLAVVDHMQLIRTGSARTRAQEVSENSRAIKLAAVDLNIPIMVLSQVDRGSVKGEGKINIHSAKESGDIEADADAVMWLESESEFSWEADTPVSLYLGKNKGGGRAGARIAMTFKPNYRAFYEVPNGNNSD
jgi:replicative DNA helicase